MMEESIPAGYQLETYWHPGHSACPKTGDPAPLIMCVPADKTGWGGVTCGACGQQLQAF